GEQLIVLFRQPLPYPVRHLRHWPAPGADAGGQINPVRQRDVEFAAGEAEVAAVDQGHGMALYHGIALHRGSPPSHSITASATTHRAMARHSSPSARSISAGCASPPQPS